VGALQGKSDGEEPLDDVVVEVPRDPVAVRQDVELAHPALRAGQLPGQRGLVSKGGHHVEPALQPILSMVLASWGAPRRQQVS